MIRDFKSLEQKNTTEYNSSVGLLIQTFFSSRWNTTEIFRLMEL